MINTQVQVNARQYASAAEIMAAAAERRKRLFGKPVEREHKPANGNVVYADAPKTVRPMWSVLRICFDQHVKESELFIRKPERKTVRDHIKKRAIELGFTYNQIVVVKRTKALVSARSQIIYECNKEFKKSLNEIGRIFNRDHTSIYHSIRCHEAKLDPNGEAAKGLRHRYESQKDGIKARRERKKVAFNAGKYWPTPGQIEVMELVASGKSYAQISRHLDIGPKSAIERLKRVCRDTRVNSVPELIALSVRKGWIK